MPRQVPVPDKLSKPFWDACNERRLMVQYCPGCTARRGGIRALQYPPAKECTICGSENLEWREVKGRGRISGYVVIHDSRMRVWWPEQPYNVAIIQLDEDPAINFFSNLPGVPVDEVPVGAPVEVMFEEVEGGQLVHEWRLVS